MTPEQAGALVAYLAAKYPSQKLNAANVAAYQDGLVDLDHEAAVLAVKRISNESKWFPAISEIRDGVVSERLQLPSPEEAWDEVMRAIDRIGSSGWPQWSHPEIGQAVHAVGWHAICGCQLRELHFKQATFMRCYESYSARSKRELGRASSEGAQLPAAQTLELTP